MSILGLLVFTFCLWAVFSRHFCDGIIVKHLLTFSAITAMLVFVDPLNTDAAITSIALLALGILYWFIKHQQLIKTRLRRKSCN